MSIRDLFDRIANVFGYTVVKREEYVGLLEQLESKQEYKEHCAYIKHWVNNYGCRKLCIDWKIGTTQIETVYGVDICGNRLIYKHNKMDDDYAVNDVDLKYVEIPESFKKEKLGKDYRTI